MGEVKYTLLGKTYKIVVKSKEKNKAKEKA